MEYIVFVDCQLIIRHLHSVMKKNIVLTIRIDEEMQTIIKTLSEDDDRTVAWMSRKLIEEALENRKLLKTSKK